MSAIEYGSYYWGVLLSGKGADQLGDSVHLHADEMSVDENGALIFRSAGRRPAGTDPDHKNGNDAQGHEPNGKEKSGGKDMIYVAFAAGYWRMVYAAKLQDGSPASVEHWNTADGRDTLPPALPGQAGAAGYPAKPPVIIPPAETVEFLR
jgi:hypothetical protein